MQSKAKVVVVGAGIIGAAAAYELQSRGADVLVIASGAARATDASFGWINASFFETPEYFALRVEGMKAYRRLQQRLDLPLNWSASLCWENAGAAFDAQFNSLSDQGYPCDIIEKSEIAKLEPNLGALPDRAIRFSSEGVAEPTETADILLAAAVKQGAQIARGFAVEGFERSGNAIVGVQSELGMFRADKVVVAAGTGTQSLLASADIPLPMLQRPALVLKTQPIKERISHVLVTEFGEVRQLPGGAIITPAAIGHQSDSAEALAHPNEAAEISIGRLSTLFPQLDLKLAAMQMAYRPVPRDGFPAVGEVAPSLYAACMHSGITLAALMGELIAEEVLTQRSNETERWLGKFRPERFR